MSFYNTRRGSRGQSLVEFALVVPMFVAVVGAVIQFGVIFWGQNSLTQIARDTGRFAATLQDCSATAPIIAKANSLASGADLIGYDAGPWTSANVAVTWPPNGTDPCPPTTNSQVRWVRVVL